MASRAETWLNLASVFEQRGRTTDALRAARTCLRLQAEDARCLSMQGRILAAHLGYEHVSLGYFMRAASIAPSLPSLMNLGLAYSHVYDNRRAGEAYAAALEHEESIAVWSQCLFRLCEVKQMICEDWGGQEERMSMLRRTTEELISKGMKPISPFLAMSLPLPPEDILAITRAHAHLAVKGAEHERQSSNQSLPFPVLRAGPLAISRRLRVVYLSATFDPNKLMNGFLRDVWWRHPTSQVEVHCVAWDMREEGGRRWIREQVEHFHSAEHQSDLGVAQLVNALHAHLLVELVGWYPEQRSGIVAHRPCRVQSLYRFIGGGGGRGDNLYITDSTSLPPELVGLVDEKILYLQPLYLACGHARTFAQAAAQQLSRHREEFVSKYNLSKDAILIGALNKYYKISPELWSTWCNILLSHPRVVLIVIRYRHYSEAIENLQREAQKRGVQASRMLVVPEGKHHEFILLGSLLDLFLDTGHPISNGHTTVLDMAWADVPVLTWAGPSKASRVASSILRAAGCSTLIARDLEDYEEVGKRLVRARDIGRWGAGAGAGAGAVAGCQKDPSMFDAGVFLHRWLLGLRAMAEHPEMNIVVPRVTAQGGGGGG